MEHQNKDLSELIRYMHSFFEEKIPFNKVLGIHVETLDLDNSCLKINMRDGLIGNAERGILHGGVISSVLDVIGGLTAAMGIINKMIGDPIDKIIGRVSNIGTIDLRIDYLRPGLGEYFLATGSVMRTGQKIAVIRMQLHNDQGKLIAVGTGTYVVG